MVHVIAATWRAKDGKADEIAEIVARLAKTCPQQEPGCISFIANRSKDDPNEFLLYEQYVDEAAFAAHQQTAHFKELVLGRALDLLDQRVRKAYSVIGA
jgi:quinol monooxygenase YgiN